MFVCYQMEEENEPSLQRSPPSYPHVETHLGTVFNAHYIKY